MMRDRLLKMFSSFSLLALFVAAVEGCGSAADCGWNSVCGENGECGCLPGYSLTNNKHDCYDERCGDKSCLECADIDTCLRCVDFIERGSGQCLESCSTQYDLVVEGIQMGKVCPEGMGGLTQTYLVLIISVCAGLLLTALLALLIYWRFRMYNDRKARLKFMEKMMERQKKESDKVAQLKQLGNPAFDGYSQPGSLHGSLHRSLPRSAAEDVRRMIEVLKPHRHHLLDMLQEAQSRLKNTDPSATNSFVYRNIMQSLGRVLTLLADDNDAALPSDAQALLQWAHRILTQYLHAAPQHNKLQDSSSTPEAAEASFPSTAHPAGGERRGVVTSTFRPDQQLITDSTDNFKYQPCPALISDSVESIAQCREVSEINIVQLLADHNIPHHTSADAVAATHATEV